MSKMYICQQCGSTTFKKSILCAMCRSGNPPLGTYDNQTSNIVECSSEDCANQIQRASHVKNPKCFKCKKKQKKKKARDAG